jgi:hypothetical protein
VSILEAKYSIPREKFAKFNYSTVRDGLYFKAGSVSEDHDEAAAYLVPVGIWTRNGIRLKKTRSEWE